VCCAVAARARSHNAHGVRPNLIAQNVADVNMHRVFSSAFCASLAQYYQEIKPLLATLPVLGRLDGLLSEFYWLLRRDWRSLQAYAGGYQEEMELVHPFPPSEVPNFLYEVDENQLRNKDRAVTKEKSLGLMDAGAFLNGEPASLFWSVLRVLG